MHPILLLRPPILVYFALKSSTIKILSSWYLLLPGGNENIARKNIKEQYQLKFNKKYSLGLISLLDIFSFPHFWLFLHNYSWNELFYDGGPYYIEIGSFLLLIIWTWPTCELKFCAWLPKIYDAEKLHPRHFRRSTIAQKFISIKNNYTLLRNSFQANVQFLYPLKTSENLRFPDVFRGCRNETMAWKGLLQQLEANYLMKQLSSRIWKIKKQLKVFSCFCQ